MKENNFSMNVTKKVLTIFFFKAKCEKSLKSFHQNRKWIWDIRGNLIK